MAVFTQTTVNYRKRTAYSHLRTKHRRGPEEKKRKKFRACRIPYIELAYMFVAGNMNVECTARKIYTRDDGGGAAKK